MSIQRLKATDFSIHGFLQTFYLALAGFLIFHLDRDLVSLSNPDDVKIIQSE